MENKNLFLIEMGGLFLVLLLLSFLTHNTILVINIMFLGVFLIISQFSLKKYFEFKKIKEIENSFPNFLRDLSESVRSGLTLMQAFRITSKSDYGLLSEEIKKMNNQLSWNIKMDKVLDMMKDRLEKSKIITKSITIISETNRTGGNTAEILEELSQNVEKLKQEDEEKKAMLHQQVLLLYAIFFIFIGISVALLKFLIPLVANTSTTGFEISGLSFGGNPCSACVGNTLASCGPCNFFFMICEIFDFGAAASHACYFRALFFSMILIEGALTGLISGQIESGSAVAGVKHSLIMFSAGFLIFLMLVGIGLI